MNAAISAGLPSRCATPLSPAARTAANVPRERTST